MQNTHLNKNELQQLLEGELDAGTTEGVISHVDSCESCRGQLEQLAAEPVWWEKAATLLADETLYEAIPGSDIDDLTEKNEPNDEPTYFPIEEFLGAPSHPEMMGRLDGYEIEREIGRGGMGVVLKAFDPELNRPLAVKVMAPHLASVGAARKRFAREARAAAAVLHPNVIAIHGVNSTGKFPYIVMPFISGCSLEELVLRSGPLDEKDIVRIALQISAGLSAAHLHGLVHRDIKPANILIENGVNRVLITDFGLARAESDASMTQTGWFAGTPNFMSPEQARGLPVDQRSDLFSLGSVIYFMATGHLPFRADGPMAVLDRIRHARPSPVREVNPDISKSLADLIDRLLEKDPAERAQSSNEVHHYLEQLLAYMHRPTRSRPPGFKKKPVSWPRVFRPVAATGSVVALLGLVMLLFSWWTEPEPQRTNSNIESIADKYDLMGEDEYFSEVAALGQAIEQIEDATHSLVPRPLSDQQFAAEVQWLHSQLNYLAKELVLPEELLIKETPYQSEREEEK